MQLDVAHEEGGHAVFAEQDGAGLRTTVDDFFDKVLVNCDDERLRANRFALLARLREAFLGVADISLLAVSA